MEPLVFSMSGVVRGKGRPRATARGGFARIYTDDQTRKYEAAARVLAKQAMRGREPFEGPLSVSLRLRLQPPRSMSKRQRARILGGEEAYFGRVDADNGAKSCLDSMNGVVYVDDVQIMRLFVTKVASDNPGVDIRVQPL